MVEEVGEENVVQVVTDNASNYVKARKKLIIHFFFPYILILKMVLMYFVCNF